MKRYYWVILVFLILFWGHQDKKHSAKPYAGIGVATWYHPGLTASGERYSPGELTCAMRKRDFGKNYLVCNMANNRCVEVRHNDFGPALYLSMMGRTIDLSHDAFSKIADPEKGVIRVRIGQIYAGAVD